MVVDTCNPRLLQKNLVSAKENKRNQTSKQLDKERTLRLWQVKTDESQANKHKRESECLHVFVISKQRRKDPRKGPEPLVQNVESAARVHKVGDRFKETVSVKGGGVRGISKLFENQTWKEMSDKSPEKRKQRPKQHHCSTTKEEKVAVPIVTSHHKMPTAR